jgi:pimeloyl-ACP methyl ester carboxylesterase
MTTTSLLPDVGIELREGYAEVGDDVRLHYVEAGDGDGPPIVLLHGFPEFWFGWPLQIAPLAAAGFRVVAPDTRGYNLSSKPEGFEAYAVDLLAADIRVLIGELGAESALLVGHELGRKHRLDHRDEPPGGGQPTRHPQRGPSAAAPAGTAQSEPAPEVLVFLLLCGTGAARGRGAAQRLALLPTLPARRTPPLHRPGNRALRRGVVAARGSGRDDQLLPRLRKTVPEGSRGKTSPDLGADTRHLGEGDSYLGSELAEPDRDDVPNLDRVERLPDASHWVHHDEAERVNQLLIDFFAPAA